MHTFSRLCLAGWIAVQFIPVTSIVAGQPGPGGKPGSAGAPTARTIAAFLTQLDTTVIRKDVSGTLLPELAAPERMLSESLKTRRRNRNEQDVANWRSIKTRQQWEQFRDRRIKELRRSLGTLTAPGEVEDVTVTKTLTGEGFLVDCLVFESRPGLFVTANLYRPAEDRRLISGPQMPGILICPSHHNPKTQSELQDMGMTWARQGCLVLVIDQPGHGERRAHPFRSSDDFPGSFRVSRQDYYFRYNTGIQLHLAGESLIGWMVNDLMRGVDLLLAQPGIDSGRIILLGAVAGGGDPAAVTAAIDSRIAAAVPFNFGGPQPESVFPLPEDAELSFNYVGGGSWESTRNLRDSARGGFLPWVIISSLAPRRLIYAHEFKWDREHDPVWKRLNRIYQWYEVPDRLASLKGYGAVTLSSNEASHCNNIGPHHRAQIYPNFEKWFGIPAPKEEYRKRFSSGELLCVEGVEAAGNISLTPLHEVAERLTRQQAVRSRESLLTAPADDRIPAVRNQWARILRLKAPVPDSGLEPAAEKEGPIRVTRAILERGEGIAIPMLTLFPITVPDTGAPLVVVVSQSGKAALLKERSKEVAELLAAGVAVAMPDLRGTGETSPGTYRGRRSYATGLSSGELMLGNTLVGQRLNDLLAVLSRMKSHSLIDETRIAVWGESLASTNAPDRRVAVPLGIDEEPSHSEPLGSLLAMLAAAFDSDVDAVLAHGGLVSFRSVLDSQFVWMPHDFVVPGAVPIGDISGLAAAIAPRPLQLTGLVTGVNRLTAKRQRDKAWQFARDMYDRENASKNLMLADRHKDRIHWLVQTLRSAE